MRIKIISSFVVTALAVLFITASGVLAQEQTSSGFRISPVIVEKTVDAGSSTEAEISIYNPTAVQVTAKIVANDFESSIDESGQPRIIFDTDKNATANSFKALVGDLGSVDIPANSYVKVPVLITVPQNSSPGGYYGVVRVESVTNSSDSSNVNLNASVGTIFMVTVPGAINESLSITEFTAAKDGSNGRFFIGGGDKIQIVTRLTNNGNIHVKPFGRIQILDSKGNSVEQFEFNDREPKANVLPNSTRKFVNDLEYSNFFGKYTITANLGYGNDGNLLTANNTFWVVPLWLVIVAGAFLIVLIVIAILIFKALSKRKNHKIKHRR